MRKIAVICAILLFVPLVVFATPVPDTGQNKCYDNSQEITCPNPGEPFHGQDAQYPCSPQLYTKLNATGNVLSNDATEWVMVRDNVTGLIWEVKTDDASINDKDTTYNWQDAQDVFIDNLNSISFGSYSDWRLPTFTELSFLVNRGNSYPSINTSYFPNTQSVLLSLYWSSTTYVYDSNASWIVDFSYGTTSADFKVTGSYYVRAVRGEEVANNFIDNVNGTVTDTVNGLIWQQGTSPGTQTWQEALSYCESLNLAEYEDWRLPDVNELQSIVDYDNFLPSINTTYFPSTQSSGYFSSSTVDNNISSYWRVFMSVGSVDGDGKLDDDVYVRCVRGGVCANDICKGNFDYDQDVDGTDASTFKQNFGRSPFKNPCPSDGPAPIPNTGQTVSYTTGDDGFLERGVKNPPYKDRFTDNEDGTVTDNLTGLIWLKNANCFGQRAWADAISDCNGLSSGSCGLTDGSSAGDWRLPNKKELISLTHEGYYNPALSNTAGNGQWTEGDPFTNVQGHTYWSSTTYARISEMGWAVIMDDGSVGFSSKPYSDYVWPVRDPL